MSENHSPEYFESILPDKIRKTRPNSRNAENVVTTKCRTETDKTKFYSIHHTCHGMNCPKDQRTWTISLKNGK